MSGFESCKLTVVLNHKLSNDAFQTSKDKNENIQFLLKSASIRFKGKKYIIQKHSNLT